MKKDSNPNMAESSDNCEVSEDEEQYEKLVGFQVVKNLKESEENDEDFGNINIDEIEEKRVLK